MDISGTTLEGLGLVRFIPGSGSAAQNPIRICVKNAAGVPVPVKLHLVVIHIGRVGGVVGGAGDGMEDEDPGHVVSVSMVGPGVLDVIYSVTDATAASVGISIKIKGLPVTPAPVIVPILLGYLGGGTFVKSYAIGAMQPHTGLAVSYDEKIMVVACAPRAAASIASIGMHVYSLPEGRRVSQIDLPLGYKPLKCCFAWQSNTNLLVIDSDLGRMLEYNVKGEQVRDFLDGGSRDMNCMAVAGDMVAIGRKVKSGKQVTIMSYASGATIAAWTTGLNRIPDAAQIDALAFTPDQTHIVCVDNQARAYICTVAGVFIKSVGVGCLTLPIPLDGMFDVMVLPNGQVTLLDAGASRVVVLDEAGNESRTWGGPGSEAGKFSGPAAFVARGAHLYVLENGPRADRVQLFT